jgi:N-lysine methyltransferase SETD6
MLTYARLVAREDLAADEVLFAVPRHMVLETPFFKILAAPGERRQSFVMSVHRSEEDDKRLSSVLMGLEEPGSWLKMIVTTIQEYLKGEKSYWYPYFQVLPTTLNLLMFWNEHELAELQASAVVNRIGKSEVEQQWKETIIPLMLAQPLGFPLEEVEEDEKIAKLIQLAHMAASLISAYSFDTDPDGSYGRKSPPKEDEDGFQEDDEDDPPKGMVSLSLRVD